MDKELALKHVTSVVRKSRTTFYWAMRFLPTEQRNAMYAVYAFCREIDDIADLPGKKNEKLGRLTQWREEIESVYSGSPKTPTSIALFEPIKKLRTELNQVIIQFGQLSVNKIQLEDQEIYLKEQLSSIEKKESDLAKNLSDKYGKGSIDLETGTFIPSE